MLKSVLEKLKQEKESNQLKIKKIYNASKSLDKLIGSQITDKSRKGVGFVSYNIVPPPYKGLFLPPKFDFSNSGLEEFQQHEFEGYGPKPSKSVSKDISNEVREYLMPHCLRQGSTKRSQGYVDMVLNAHGTGNMSYLSDFKEFDGGYVTFRGGAKGGKITSKRTLKTGDVKGRWDFYYPRQLVLLAWLNAIGRKVSAARQKFNAIRPSGSIRCQEAMRDIIAQTKSKRVKGESQEVGKEEKVKNSITQEKIIHDYELATKLQAEEQGEISIEERSKLFMELMNERNKHFARLRAKDHRRKPLTKAQKRNQMSNYLKNMTGYTL
ncbi:hypothetical protein Tco_1533400 [Tanacetum coccineum]